MDTTRQDDTESLRTLLAEHARRDAASSGAGAAASPAPEELLALLEGELPPEVARRVERQLLAEPEVARDLLDLAEFTAAEAAAGQAPPQVATHAGWRDFERRMDQGPARRRPPSRWLAVVAAGLFLAAVGLAVFSLKLRAPAPLVVANLATLELVADTRGEDAEITLPSGAPLRLVLAPAERCPAYSAVLRRTAGAGDPWSRTVDGLDRDPLGRVSLLLTAAPGTYELDLSGCDPPRRLESHRFHVAARN